jgi:hypothetical protein
MTAPIRLLEGTPAVRASYPETSSWQMAGDLRCCQAPRAVSVQCGHGTGVRTEEVPLSPTSRGSAYLVGRRDTGAVRLFARGVAPIVTRITHGEAPCRAVVWWLRSVP